MNIDKIVQDDKEKSTDKPSQPKPFTFNLNSGGSSSSGLFTNSDQEKNKETPLFTSFGSNTLPGESSVKSFPALPVKPLSNELTSSGTTTSGTESSSLFNTNSNSRSLFGGDNFGSSSSSGVGNGFNLSGSNPTSSFQFSQPATSLFGSKESSSGSLNKPPSFNSLSQPYKTTTTAKLNDKPNSSLFGTGTPPISSNLFGNNPQSGGMPTPLFGSTATSDKAPSFFNNTTSSTNKPNSLFAGTNTISADNPTSLFPSSFSNNESNNLSSQNTSADAQASFTAPSIADNNSSKLFIPPSGLDLLSQATSLSGTASTNHNSSSNNIFAHSKIANQPFLSVADMENIERHLSDPTLAMDSSFYNSPPEFSLEEAPIPPGGIPQWSKSNRTLKFTLSTVGDEGIAWIDRRNKDNQSLLEENSSTNKGRPALEQELKLYTAAIPSSLKYSTGYCRFVADAYNIVKECQDEIITDNNSSTSVNKICMNYLQRFCETIEASLDNIEDNIAMVDALYIVICFSVIHFNSTVMTDGFAKPFSSSLSEWANRVDPGFSAEDTSDIMKTSPPTNHPLFWDLVHDRASRGLLEVCATTLREAYTKDFEPDVLECIDYATQLLRSYPEGSGESYKFPQWRTQCIIAYDKATEISDPELRIQLVQLFGIMKGDIQTILNKNNNSWFVALSALVQFHDPSRSRLKEYFEIVKEQIPIDSTLEWESGCAAVISGDILIAIQKIESLDSCIATTMAELCQMRGLLDDYSAVQVTNGPSVRDWLVLNHAQSCLASQIPELAKTGIEMLVDLDIPQSRETIAEYLPRHIAEDVEELEWIISIADQLGLYETERKIHRFAARNYIRSGCYIDALIELDKAQDIAGLQAYSWRLFEDTIIQNEVAADPITIEAVRPDSGLELSPVVREIISPFAVLAEILESMKEGRYSEAGSRLVALIKFPYLPNKFLGPLLSMIIPLLSHDMPRVFSTRDIVLIIDYLDMWNNQEGGNKETNRSYREGLDIIEKAIEIGSKKDNQSYNSDWLKQFSSVSSENISAHILNTARIALAREVSRAYLSGV